jgi:hypothetical protein
MNCYRVIFEDNRIISCEETPETISGKEPYYEHNDGLLSFAIIKADNESQARSIAKYLAIEMMQQYKRA